MEKPALYLPKQLSPGTMARLADVCKVRAWEGDGKCPPDVVMSEVSSADAVLGHYRWTAEIINRAPRLRVIANIGVGFDNVDVAAATSKRIVVTNTPDVLTETTADLAFALLMATARRLGEAERFIRAGNWTSTKGSESLLGRDVHGATLGIIGLGRIGSAVARRALGFDMQVIYYDPVPRPELEAKHGYRLASLETLMGASDFVSIHMPLSSKTRGMIGAKEISMMKPTAYLINAARGPVIDERALIRALTEGRIAGAGLDVFETEPVSSDNPLLRLDNVVTLPHVGSATVSTRLAMERLAADNVLAVVQGNPPLTPVNPEVLD